MALIVLGAAKGAPGVTVTTTALAAVWPSPVILVEADPSGSDLHLLLHSDGGRPLQGGQRGAGMLGLAAHGGSRATLLDEPICQQTDLGVPVVIGPPHSRAAYAMGPAWGQVAHSLIQLSREGHYDVLVDIGRVDDQSLALPLIHRADIMVLLAKRNLRGIAHTRRVAGHIEEQLRMDTASAAAAAAYLLIVDDPATAARVETQWAVAAKGLTRPWPTLGAVTYDSEGTHDFFNARSSRRDVNNFTNSVREVATELHDRARHLPTSAAEPASESAPAFEVASAYVLTETETATSASLPAATAPAFTSDHARIPSNMSSSAFAVTANAVPVSTAPATAIVWPPLPPSRRGATEASGGADLNAQDFSEDGDHGERAGSDENSQTPSVRSAQSILDYTPSDSAATGSEATSSSAAAEADHGPDHNAAARDVKGPPVRRRQRLTGAQTRTS